MDYKNSGILRIIFNNLRYFIKQTRNLKFEVKRQYVVGREMTLHKRVFAGCNEQGSRSPPFRGFYFRHDCFVESKLYVMKFCIVTLMRVSSYYN